MPATDESLPLFAYGTLMYREVIAGVIGREPRGQAAEARGYSNYLVKHQVFPGLVKDGGPGVVSGILYGDLAPEDWARLNDYEDDFYELREITVTSGGEERAALAYIVPALERNRLTGQHWVAADYREIVLARFRRSRDLQEEP